MSLRFLLYLVLLLIVSLVGAIRFTRVNISFKILTLLVNLTFLSECASRILAIVIHNSIPVYHIISPVEFIGFSLTYYYWVKNHKTKKLLLFFIFLLVAAAIIDTLYFETLFIFPAKYLMLCDLIYLFYALLGFKIMMLHPNQTLLFKQSFFWVNAGLLMYTGIALLSFGLHEYFLNIDSELDVVDDLIYIINIIFYFFIGVSILMDKLSFNNG